MHRVPLEAKAVMREALIGLMTSEEIEVAVNERRSVPKSLLRPLSPEVRAILKEMREGLRDGITAAPPCGAAGPSARD